MSKFSRAQLPKGAPRDVELRERDVLRLFAHAWQTPGARLVTPRRDRYISTCSLFLRSLGKNVYTWNTQAGRRSRGSSLHTFLCRARNWNFTAHAPPRVRALIFNPRGKKRDVCGAWTLSDPREAIELARRLTPPLLRIRHGPSDFFFSLAHRPGCGDRFMNYRVECRALRHLRCRKHCYDDLYVLSESGFGMLGRVSGMQRDQCETIM